MALLNFGPKKLGFGCMRMPILAGTLAGAGVRDTLQLSAIVGAFLKHSFFYVHSNH